MAKEIFEVHSSMTNAVKGSSVDVYVNTQRICPNMTNAQFRELVFSCRDEAVQMTDARLNDLRRWNQADKARVDIWFGRCDETTRQTLIRGLSAISRVLKTLKAENFVRWDPDHATHISCSPNLSNALGAVAEVCAPDTETHTIAIREAFCEMRSVSYAKDSMVSTLIHEASHFNDTMATKDWRYFMRECLPLGKTNPEQAIENADSIAGYVIYSM
ncbi:MULTISPECIES: M35 family metallo-endopeptidase [unclassified Caballeronia]|uniref:M35 family metallo-endopeptidase n=1 Tax=unclassified Caballeronia TaxID=2646786 RepID=UPI002028B1EA|nr:MULTISPECIES: M35 family metallo-endopeptidase [unclassified Caballeronia]